MTLSNPAATPGLGVAEDGPGELETIYREHRGWLIAFLRRRFGHEMAEDLAQEAFARSLSARTSIRRPRAFLIRVALNTARNQIRDAEVRPRLTAEGPESQNASAPADQVDLLALKETILALPPKLRDVFILSRFGGLTYEEIGAQLGIPVKTVEWRMSKAIRLCVARMRD
jgi:RNA polymerase sigma-70 factor (ECF subfamily)